MEQDPVEFRNALGLFATGVTIITTLDGERPLGLTANSFNSVSLDPKLLLWSMAKSSGVLSTYQRAPGYCIHILGLDQLDLSNTFARPSDDRFAEVEWEPSPSLGLPLIKNCIAYFECESEHQYEGGDHIIFVGKVVSYGTGPERSVLGFHKGKYVSTTRV